jgi:hypothetical protein
MVMGPSQRSKNGFCDSQSDPKMDFGTFTASPKWIGDFNSDPKKIDFGTFTVIQK